MLEKGRSTKKERYWDSRARYGWTKRALLIFLVFAELSNQYHIKYNNSIEDAFYVGDKKSGKYQKFPKNLEGLYTFKFDKKYQKALNQAEGKSLVKTVAKNLDSYSNNQQHRAKIAKQLYHKLGANGIENFKICGEVQHDKELSRDPGRH